MKAKQCDECKFFSVGLIYPYRAICSKGHKPRFYSPISLSDAHKGNWGWKRRCDDFEDAA